MADDKNSRDEQSDNADRRQRERGLAETLERTGEKEPPTETADLSEIEREIGGLDFPITGKKVLESLGDQKIGSDNGSYSIEELVPDTDEETFGSASELRERVQRPKVSEAMKRTVEKGTEVGAEFGVSQREAYEKTFRELVDIDAVDDDEGLTAIADWIVKKTENKGAFPGSRAVRRRAAEYCRANGYSVSNDEWLGV